MVVDADWQRARSWLLESDPATSNMQADAVLRAVLRGFARSGPLPGQLDPKRPFQAVVIMAHGNGPSTLSVAKLEEIAANEAALADPRSFVLDVDGVRRPRSTG